MAFTTGQRLFLYKQFIVRSGLLAFSLIDCVTFFLCSSLSSVSLDFVYGLLMGEEYFDENVVEVKSQLCLEPEIAFTK